jgi:NAD(P)H-dependent flavin oxidoreductase YrpB (nitropropane dioxygenase family)
MATATPTAIGALADRRAPIIQAPMAGGPSTVDLTVAVADAGAFGFVAAGYRTADELRATIGELRTRTDAPFGVNLFADRSPAAPAEVVAAYAERISPLADAHGVELGHPVTTTMGWPTSSTSWWPRRRRSCRSRSGCPTPTSSRRCAVPAPRCGPR